MKEKLLSYLLEDLSPAERAEIEAALAADPALQDELAKLQECMGMCEEAEPDSIPPTQLAKRTCCFVDHAIQKSQAVCHSAAHATKRLSENRDQLNPNRRWTMADFIGTVCVCAALGGLIIPALRGSRDIARGNTCERNLHTLASASMDYALFKDQGVPQVGPDENAGMYIAKLVQGGYLSPEEAARAVVCPDSQLAERVAKRCVIIYIPTEEELRNASLAKQEYFRKWMGGSYAYPLGHRNAAGKLQPVRLQSRRDIPLLGDAPSHEIAGYQSANHGGCGQYFLFQDLSVKYRKQCKCAAEKDHWYLNDEGQPAAGLHPNDVVLAPSEVVPVLKGNLVIKK
jgi:hypothetical protein